MTRDKIIAEIVKTIDGGISSGHDGSAPCLTWQARRDLGDLLYALCDEIVREAIEP